MFRAKPMRMRKTIQMFKLMFKQDFSFGMFRLQCYWFTVKNDVFGRNRHFLLFISTFDQLTSQTSNPSIFSVRLFIEKMFEDTILSGRVINFKELLLFWTKWILFSSIFVRKRQKSSLFIIWLIIVILISMVFRF